MAQSVYKNLFTQPLRELDAKLELVDFSEPEYFPADGTYTININSTTAMSLTLPNVAGDLITNIAVGDIVKVYTSNKNDILYKYSCAITAVRTSGLNDLELSLTNPTGLEYPTTVTNTIDRLYFVKKEIIGKIVDGDVTIDGQNKARRSMNLTISVDVLSDSATIKISDFENKRIKSYVGLTNLLNEDLLSEANGLPPDVDNKIWFKMGVYSLTDLSLQHSLDSLILKFTAQDKTNLIDGNGGGLIGATYVLGYQGQSISDSYYDSLISLLTNFGNQRPQKIHVNFTSNEHENYFMVEPSLVPTPGYTASFKVNTYTSAAGMTAYGLKVYSNFSWSSTAITTATGVTVNSIATYSTSTFGLTVSGNTTSTSQITHNIWRNFGNREANNIGQYRDVPLELQGTDSISSFLDSQVLPKLWPGTEYYFDENGDFILKQDIKYQSSSSYVNPLNLKLSKYIINTQTNQAVSDFYQNSNLVRSYSKNTRLSSAKNDFYVFGQAVGLGYSGDGTTFLNQKDIPTTYHAVITTTPGYCTSIGINPNYYKNTGTTYGYPFQVFIADGYSSDALLNYYRDLTHLAPYGAEIENNFLFNSVPGITEWSVSYKALSAGNTVYVIDTNNYYSVKSSYTSTNFTAVTPPFPTNGTVNGLEYLGLYNSYAGIYKKVKSSDPNAVYIGLNFDGSEIYCVQVTTTGVTVSHFGIYRSDNTGIEKVDFNIKNPLGDYATWNYWFDILDEKIPFWKASSSFTSASYVYSNNKTYYTDTGGISGLTAPAGVTTFFDLLSTNLMPCVLHSALTCLTKFCT
jgi:hypothetical protein